MPSPPAPGPGRDLPATLTAALQGTDQRAGAAVLDRLGRPGPDDDLVLPLRAMLLTKAGRSSEALAAAWRAAALAAPDARLIGLAALLLDRAGAAPLAERLVGAAVAAAPADRGLALLRLERLKAHAPDRARAVFHATLPLAPRAELTGWLRLATALGIGQIGAVAGDDDEIAGWAATRPGVTGRVVAEWDRGGRRLRHVLCEIADGAAEAAEFTMAWPETDGPVDIAWDGGAALTGAPLLRRPQIPARADPERTVDVIILVYRGAAETEACLDSVLSGGCAQPMRVIAVDDASPEPAVSVLLDRLADKGAITLLRNPRNLGFTASANRGIALGPGRDVVLLNADTIVAPGWLDRLARAAASGPQIASVTPLSNSGQIVSYPAPYRGMACPGPGETAEIDRRAARLNAGETVPLPTGIGFCLYLRRAALDAVGMLDSARFGRGYGEEIGFCRLAALQGWRNLCAADVFVAHRGAVSFGAEKAALAARNDRVIDAIDPSYREALAEFLRRDPLMPARRRLERARLSGDARPSVLAVGTAAVRRGPLAARMADDAARAGRALVWLVPDPMRAGASAVLRRGSEGTSLRYDLVSESDLLLSDVQALGVEEVFRDAGPLPDLWESVVDRVSRPVTAYVASADQLGALAQASGQVRVGTPEAQRALAARGVAAMLWSPPACPLPRVAHAPAALRRGHVAVFGDLCGLGHRALLELAHAARIVAPELRFFVIGRSVDDAGLMRSRRVEVLGRVEPDDRAALGAALGCGLGLVIEGARCPIGLLAREALGLSRRVAALASGIALSLAPMPEPVLVLDPAEGMDAIASRLAAAADGDAA